jgi:hypothetical protein
MKASARHTTGTMLLARTMYGDGDAWSPTEIVRYLAEQGVIVDRVTVLRWVDPGFAERRRREQRDAAKRRRARVAPTLVLDRMRELRSAGLSFSGIAVVVRLDWGVDLSGDQVRYYLRTGREPRIPKRKAAAGADS